MRYVFIVCLLLGISGLATAQKPRVVVAEQLPDISNGKVSGYLKIPAKYRLLSCAVILNTKGEIIQSMTWGDELSNPSRNLIARARTGDIIIFSDVVLQKQDSSTIKWPDKAFSIK